MIAIRILGGSQLEAPGRPEAAAVSAQPKRFALLVYLTLTGPGGRRRRDELLALFWPDADQDRGRRVLRQTIYLLRQSLGPDAIISHGDEDLGVNPDQVECDAAQFERAIAEGRLAEALDLYGGDFLRGFHVPEGSQELEDWIADERRRLRALASSAAWMLAARAERAGDAEGALGWARRAAGYDRDNEDAVRDLMQLMIRLGDRVGAARVFEEHARRLQRDFEMEPGVTLRKLAASLREKAAAVAAPPDAAVPLPAPAPTALTAAAPPAPPAPTRAGTRFRIGGWLIAAAGAALILGTAAAVRGARARAPHPSLLAVGSISEIAGPDSSVESAVTSDLLATSLARITGIAVVPQTRLQEVQAQLRSVRGRQASLLAAARQAGASQLLTGTVHRRGAGYAFDGQVLDLSSGRVIRAFRAEGADLFELIDHATEALAGAFGESPPPGPIRDVTTGSLVAYRLYQEGLRQLYAQEDARASYGLFRAALEEDSAFALAAYYAGVVANIMHLGATTDSLFRRANRLAVRTTDRERLIIRYRIADLTQLGNAVALGETLAVRYPDELDAIFARASQARREGRWGEATAGFRRLIETDSLSLHAHGVRCVACDAYVELWWTYVYADSMAAAEAVVREQLARAGFRPGLLDLLAVAQARQNNFTGALRSWRLLYDSLAPSAAGWGLQRAWVAIRAGDLAAADTELAVLQRAAPSGMADYRWYYAISLRNQGRLRDVLALPDAGGAPGIALFEAGRYREAAAVFESAVRHIDRSQPETIAKQLTWDFTHLATCLAAAGDTSRLEALADSTERIGALSNFGRDPRLHHYIRGLLWLARRDTAAAAREFQASIWSWSDGYSRANYELARSLLALGRPRDAVYPLQAALRGDLQSSNLYVTRTELHETLGRAFEALGERDSAAVHYRIVLRDWQHADPPFQARRAHAAAFLARRA